MEGAKSKQEAMLIKAAEELKAQRLDLLKRARKSVEIGGQLLSVAANRLDATQDPTDPVEMEESDVAALIAASTNASAAASNILKAIVIGRPAIQVVGAGDAQGIIASA